MYPVKVTETNFNIVLYRDGVGLIRGLKPREAGRTMTARLANDLSGTREQNRGLGGVSTRHVEYRYLSQLKILGRGVQAEGIRRPANSEIQNYLPYGPVNNKCEIRTLTARRLFQYFAVKVDGK